jgi:hypothetical protein
MMRNQNNMSLLINYFLIVWCFVIHLGQSDQSIVSSWYKTQITSRVVPPYSIAYKTLNEKIVQQLLTVSIDSDETTIRRLIDTLACASETVQKKLGVAVRASESIGNSIDGKINQLVRSVTNQERWVQEAQKSVNEANINIEHTQQQITLAENAVKDKLQSVNAAERDVHDADQAIKDARTCRGRRRKRGWFRDIFVKPIEKVVKEIVVKPVCSVINRGGINNAEDRRTLAEGTLHEAQQRLADYQQNLENQHFQHQVAQTRLNQANSQLNMLTSQLNEQRATQVAVSSLVKQLRGIEVHLKTVLGSSTVLQDAISQLIDFELVIEPLNDIYHEMIKNNAMASFNFVISAEMASKTLTNLKVLADKMPKMPLNEIIVKRGINCLALTISKFQNKL